MFLGRLIGHEDLLPLYIYINTVVGKLFIARLESHERFWMEIGEKAMMILFFFFLYLFILPMFLLHNLCIGDKQCAVFEF